MSTLVDVSTYFRLVLVLLGIVGNSLTICLMFRRKFNTSLGFYMLVLALSDLGVMLFAQGYFLLDSNGLIPLSDGLCKVRAFLMYTCYHMSSLSLTCMTFERALVLLLPHRSRELCTRRKARIVIACIFAVVFAVNIPTVFAFEESVKPSGKIYCALKGLPSYFKNIHPNLHLLLANFGPYFIIMGSNAVIISILVRRVNQKLSVNDNSKDTMARMTALLLTVSFAFIFLTLPTGIYIVGRPHWYKDNPSYGRSYENPALVVITLASCANHAINFFLYIVSGSTFRAELRAMLTCKSEAEMMRERSMRTITSNVSISRRSQIVKETPLQQDTTESQPNTN